jgi:hypothetical protein
LALLAFDLATTLVPFANRDGSTGCNWGVELLILRTVV